MTKSDKSKLIKQNTICWFAAIILPLMFHFAFANTKFPWPVVLPILLLAPMLASNNLVSKAAGEASDDGKPK